MSLETIRDLANEQARKAAREKRKPYAIFDEAELNAFGTNAVPFPFPNLGTYVPKGWRLVEQLFCDSTGWGSDREPALSARQLKEKLREHIRAGNKYAYAITECGQFQLYLGVFEKTKRGSHEAH